MSRFVACRNLEGKVISDTQCDPAAKPLAVHPCGDKNCPAHWVEQEWDQVKPSPAPCPQLSFPPHIPQELVGAWLPWQNCTLVVAPSTKRKGAMPQFVPPRTSRFVALAAFPGTSIGGQQCPEEIHLLSHLWLPAGSCRHLSRALSRICTHLPKILVPPPERKPQKKQLVL